jgi:hypothetical protein
VRVTQLRVRAYVVPSFGMTATEDTPDREAVANRIEAAHRRIKERDQLRGLLDQVRQQLEHAKRELADCQQQAQLEQSDVDKLESFSGTRIWAMLTGKHEESLRQEELQAEAALGKAAEARARCDELEGACAEVAGHLSGYANVDAELAAAAAERERLLVAAGAPEGKRLGEIAEESGDLRGELHQLDEAIAAGQRAVASMSALEDQLGTASGWSTYDTFFGGGMISTAIKHDHMDRAAALSRDADAALRGFGRELGEVGLRGVDEALTMSDGTRFLDMWFDNMFTDLSVRSQIQSAQERTQRARADAQRMLHQVSIRRGAIVERISSLETERRQLLH